jgi:hypothetical protein
MGVGLLVLGLEAPAFAAAAVTSFTPTSGPAAGGCVVVVTGTGFSTSPSANTTVNFVGPTTVASPTVTVISDTELWATTPSLTAGASYAIRVDNLQGQGTPSTQTFTATTGPGACAPTITTLAPTCGAAGTVLKITGTNLLAPDQGGGLVEFSPFTAGDGVDASPTNPDISEPTTLQVTVPSGAADGPISVTTFTGSEVFSTTAFQVPPPDCPTTTPTGHARSITLALKKHLVARGKVSLTDSADTTTACVSGVTVKIQRRASGHWKTVGTTTTSDTGSYKRKVKDKPGKYRALAPKATVTVDTAEETCLKAVSPTRKHTH